VSGHPRRLTTSEPTRWRVERAGAPLSGYLRGWIAFNPKTEVGQYFTSHAAAIDFATTQFDEALAREYRKATA